MSEERDSSWFCYVCQHGASNTPCPLCFPDYPPEDASWIDRAPEGGGLSDYTNVMADAGE